MQFGVSKSSQTVIDLSDIQPVPTPQIYGLPKGFIGTCRYTIQPVPT